MAVNPSTTPTPPRLSGNTQQDLAAIVDWGYSLYRALVIEQRLGERLNAISALTKSAATISSPPTQAEVTEIQTLVNAIIDATQAPVSS